MADEYKRKGHGEDAYSLARELLTRMRIPIPEAFDDLPSEPNFDRHEPEPAPIDVDLHDTGELAPVLAAVCARASGPSTLRGIAHLRLHETDRLSALAHELSALGALVTELPDGLRIEPAPLHGAPFATYDDHRLATAGAVLGLVVPGVTAPPA